MLAAMSWVGSYVALIEQSCHHAVDAYFVDDRLLCSADITMIMADLLDVATIGQIIGNARRTAKGKPSQGRLD